MFSDSHLQADRMSRRRIVLTDYFPAFPDVVRPARPHNLRDALILVIVPIVRSRLRRTSQSRRSGAPRTDCLLYLNRLLTAPTLNNSYRFASLAYDEPVV